MNKQLLFLLLPLWLVSCGSEPRPIEYGSDMCVYCKMTIVDKQHAAMAVTDKGKVYTFDAIECLVPFLQSQDDLTFRQLSVNDYQTPGALLDAETSTYLISREIPSPMGAFLSAFASREKAEAVQASSGGELFDWEALNIRLTR
jgi:copper chaperone NosL